MTKRLLLLAGVLLIAATSGGWIHGRAPPDYPNRRDASVNISCENNVKDGKDLKVIGPVTVDGKTYQDHVVTSHEEIEAVDAT